VSSVLRQDDRIARLRPRLDANVLAVSVVTVAELKRGAMLARWGERKTAELEEHLGTYVLIAVDRDVAEEWARVRVRSDHLGRQKSDNDLWIAATAKRHGLPLVTLDRDQYDIPGIAVVQHDGTEVAVPE